MKFKNIKKLTWLSLALMFLSTSCRDDTFADFRDDNSDEYNISLTVDLEGMGDRTRDTRELLNAKISGGSQIDVLKYAVYFQNDEGRWEADSSYGVENAESDGVGEVKPGHGQTVLEVKQFPVVINLALKKSQTYKIAFWAQNSETEAFVTEDLMKVQMKYKLMDDNTTLTSVNNDERRDAFCRTIDVAPGTILQGTVYLRRPLAQINVGTRGYDYETITRNAPKKYLYSKIRINRAARYLNVVEDKIYTTTVETDENAESTEAFYTIDYEYEKFPAYWKMNLPDYPSYTINDDYSTIFQHKNELTLQQYKDLYGKEEFLKVKMYSDDVVDSDKEHVYSEDDDDDGYRDYVSLGTGTNMVDTRTETFKYLSMCYILTNIESTTDGNGVVEESSDVLNNIKMWIATDKDGTDEVEVLNLNNVPVQRNRRTNIVGQLLTARANVEIKLDNDFAGQKFDGTNALSGEIVDGFYYDGNNTFEISNLNGLLFFQELVNGDLTVRQIAKSWDLGIDGVRLGSPYPYYDTKHKLNFLDYNSYRKSDFEPSKAQLIIEGTRFKDSTRTLPSGYNIVEGDDDNNDWPDMNNFSFYGCTVKLMADIDLSGIDWIPIGFDIANWDSSIRNTYQPITDDSKYSGESLNYAEIVKGTTVTFKNRRVFAGTFDGNGHTIYNLKTKVFGVDIHESAFQESSETGVSYDNVVWFPKGFFGLVGPGAIIKDLRLQGVNIYGCNGVAGIVGQVSSSGFSAKIENCVVDRGRIIGDPLYRGDYKSGDFNRRSGARGVYVGGIVGQFNAKGDDVGVTGCEVRNLEIKGYRRVGGIIGGIGDMDRNNSSPNITANILVKNNTLSNSLVLCDQFTIFSYVYNAIGSDNDPNQPGHKVWLNGFGWGAYGQIALSNKLVGGISSTGFNAYNKANNEMYTTWNGYNDQVNSDALNTISNVQFAVLRATGKDNENYAGIARSSTIENLPLEYFPMLTSWFVDEVTLENNYYGTPSTYTHREYDDCPLWGDNPITFRAPFANFPAQFGMTFDEKSAPAGLYVESINLNGYGNNNGGRSVITPTGVDVPNACVMYVGARDRHQFVDESLFLASGHGLSGNDDATWIATQYHKPTTISNVVLRGSPYAWAGIIVSPNENMSVLTLENVTIYDVYQTIALDEDSSQGADWYQYTYDVNKKGNRVKDLEGNDVPADWIQLVVKNSNLRGYTVPGAGWPSIKYEKTTFEQGAETPLSNEATEKSGNANFKTCKVEAPTTFTNCFFKAPFIIDLSARGDHEIIFDGCNATSAYKNVPIDEDKAATAKKIIIGTNIQKGETTVEYEY